VRPFLASLRRHRRLVKDLVGRDLRARYVGSSMGFFWSVVFPVINLFVYMFVFRTVLNTRWSDKMGAQEVALLMLAGVIVWHAFAEGTSRMTNTLVENSNLIQKVVFPAETLPVYLTLSSLVNMGIGIAVAILAVTWFDFFPPVHLERPIGVSISLVCLPLLALLQGIFMLGLGFLLATLNLFLRDTFHVIGVLLTVWMFTTPIFYPAFLVEKAGFGWILAANPMHWLVDSYREVLIYGDWPRPELLAGFALAAALTLLAGSTFFMAQKPRFPDLL